MRRGRGAFFLAWLVASSAAHISAVPPRYDGKYAGTREADGLRRALDRAPEEAGRLYLDRLGLDAGGALSAVALLLQDASSLPAAERESAGLLARSQDGPVWVRAEFLVRGEGSLAEALAESVVAEAVLGDGASRWDSLPAWFREGARLYVGGGERLLRDRLARRPLDALIEGIDGLQGRHQERDQLEDYLAFVVIGRRLGARGMEGWIARVRAGEAPEDALSAAWGAGWGEVLEAVRAGCLALLEEQIGPEYRRFEALYAEYREADDPGRMRLVPRWQDLVRRFPDAVWSDRAWYYLARCYDGADRHDLAAEAFEKARMAGGRPSRADDASYHLARSWDRAGRRDPARDAYAIYLRDWFDGSHRADAYAALVSLEAVSRRPDDARRWLAAFEAELPEARQLRAARRAVEGMR